MVLVPNIGISTSISNTTQIRPQHFRIFMCVHWECAWCQYKKFVLAQAYPILHKYAQITSETTCASPLNVHSASAKYWYQHQRIQHYTSTPTALQKLHVCPLGMCVVLVPNIGHRTTISHTTQIRPQHLVNFKCVSTGNVCGASAKYWYQHKHIKHYTNTPTTLKKLYVCPLGMCVVLVQNIALRTTKSNTTLIRPQHFRNFICVHQQSALCQYQIFVLAQASQYYRNTPTALQNHHVCPLGRCVVLVPNIGLRTTISYTTLIRPQNFRNLMCIHLQCVWCQCQILILAPPYPTLHKYPHNTS